MIDESAENQPTSVDRRSETQVGDVRYRVFLEGTPLPSWIFDGSTMAIVDVNQRAVEHYGYSRDEMLCMTLHDLDASGESTPRAEAGAKRIARHRKRDGAVIVVEMTEGDLRIGERPLSVAIIEDITARLRDEERMRQQAALLDAANDAIVVRDLGDEVVYWNAAAEKTFGHARAEALGRRFSDLVSLSALPPHEASLATALSETLARGSFSGEFVRHASDAPRTILAMRMTLVREADGRPRSVLTICTDVTERRELEEQYVRAQRMESIGALAGGLAHDLNNVLAPILMSVDLLRCGPVSPELAETLETIEAAAARGAQMVKQVLSFAQGVEPKRERVRPDDLVADVERIVRDSFPKSVSVSLRIEDDVPGLVGDATQLRQVLLNLAVNARDAMPRGGTLELSVEREDLDEPYVAMNPDARLGSYVVLSVSDTGEGIDPDTRKHVFEPFFTTKQPGRGTGLGLPAALGIVRSYGGFIQLRSEPGRGTTFRVFLPAAPAATSPRERQEPPKGRGETLLLVDDEASIRAVTKQTLEAFGYRVLTAADGAEAVAVFAKHEAEISVVITDVGMPVMDGVATIHALSRIDPDVRVIAVSGVERPRSLSDAGAGVRRFIEKPFTAATILTALRDVIGDDPEPVVA